MTFEELSHYLRLGGATLAFILAASVLSIGVAVERWIALWNISANSRALTDAVGRHLLRGDVSAAKGTVDRADTPLADVYRVAFERLERTRTVTPGVEAAVDRERAQLGLRLKKNLWILGTIGATTPFVGLFGTVAGIMRSLPGPGPGRGGRRHRRLRGGDDRHLRGAGGHRRGHPRRRGGGHPLQLLPGAHRRG